MRKAQVALALALATILSPLAAEANDLKNILGDPGRLAAIIQIYQATRGVSQSDLSRLGSQLDQGLVSQYGTTTNGLERVQRVVGRLEPDSKNRPEAKVLRASEDNAMAVPGHVYITGALLRKLSDDELAGVMGHELGHLKAGHTKTALKRTRIAEGIGGALKLAGANNNFQQGVTVASVLQLLSYSRKQEYEADRIGVEIATRAGYSPDGLPNALRKLPKEKDRVEFLSTHPATDSRTSRLQAAPAKEKSAGHVMATKPDPLSRRRIEIDADKITLEGNYGYYVREHLAAMLREACVDSGAVEVAVTGKQYDAVTVTQDRINESGRYSPESRQQVQRGKMVAPTDHYQVTGSANILYRNRGGSFYVSGQNVNLQRSEAKAVVKLVIEPLDIESGLNAHGYTVTGEVTKDLATNISGGSWGSYGSGNSSSYNIEQEIVEQAAEKAVGQFYAQLDPKPLDEEKIPLHRKDIVALGGITLHVENGQTMKLVVDEGQVHRGDYIVFSRGETPVVVYQVLAVDGQDLKVRTEKSGRTGPGDRFQVECP